ncbi:hypothetical protein M0802_014669 [Mischocyttarus mexicanus]|nr:hypothetical protein M0802_014669 [Mischocyttarus mexicanus]
MLIVNEQEDKINIFETYYKTINSRRHIKNNTKQHKLVDNELKKFTTKLKIPILLQLKLSLPARKTTKYLILNSNAVTDSDMSENEQVQKIPPPPPIYIENVLDIQSLTKCLNDAIKKENYTYKNSNNQPSNNINNNNSSRSTDSISRLEKLIEKQSELINKQSEQLNNLISLLTVVTDAVAFVKVYNSSLPIGVSRSW